jgi:hypothetical protein
MISQRTHWKCSMRGWGGPFDEQFFLDIDAKFLLYNMYLNSEILNILVNTSLEAVRRCIVHGVGGTLSCNPILCFGRVLWLLV